MQFFHSDTTYWQWHWISQSVCTPFYKLPSNHHQDYPSDPYNDICFQDSYTSSQLCRSWSGTTMRWPWTKMCGNTIWYYLILSVWEIGTEMESLLGFYHHMHWPDSNAKSATPNSPIIFNSSCPRKTSPGVIGSQCNPIGHSWWPYYWHAKL